MGFVIIEILYNLNCHITTIPVLRGKDLFNLCWVLDKAETVIAFKVIDSSPVLPEVYGWANFDKWVLKFTSEHFEKSR
jgi:hypothetical protein